MKIVQDHTKMLVLTHSPNVRLLTLCKVQTLKPKKLDRELHLASKEETNQSEQLKLLELFLTLL